MKCLPIIAAIACAAVLAPAAEATDRYYRDSYGVSPNGRYRIDAKSPDNAGERPRPFAESFTYTLTDTTTKKIVWERKQPMTRGKGDSSAHSSEGSPMAVFVNDEGIVAARLAWDTLLFLDPADGRTRGEAKVLGAFPQSQQDQFVSRTTAGPMWAQESDWFFLSVPGAGKQPAATYFVVRPYWNHRLVIDVATAKHVDLGSHANAASADGLANADASVKRLLTATIADETRRALAALAVTRESLANSKDYRVYWELSTALHTIGFLKLTEAEAGLRSLENIMGSGLENVADLRSNVREALRSIGKTPAAGHGVQLYPPVERANSIINDWANPYLSSVPLEQRLANAPKVEAGMTGKAMTDLIGCPDAEVFDGGWAYDYDIDAPTPYTLRVYMNHDRNTIRAVKTITPFAFLHDAARQRGR